MNRKLVEKADYLLSREQGTVFKDPGGRINIALVYPNIYPVGMSSLGFQRIYGLLNSMHDVVCERAFLPGEEEIAEYVRTGTELFSLESKRTLSRFDIVAFSVSFENDYPNIIKILKLSKIPHKRSERSSSHPLIIMGGVCAFYNPEPVADFIDFGFTGEAEEMLEEFLSVYRQARTREEVLEQGLKVEGVYVPRFYSVSYDSVSGRISGRIAAPPAPEIIKKRTLKDISSHRTYPLITTPEAEFSDMYLIEAMRGCVWSCRFCVAGHIYKPARKKDPAKLAEEISIALEHTRRVGLIGPSLSDYPHIEEVLLTEGVDFSITSLRASPRSAGIVNLLKGHKSVSIAPEAGTQRLRDVINKKITDGDIYETAKLILDSGIGTLRLYFMIGLPTETVEDIEGIIDLVRTIRDRSGKGNMTLSVSTFVPKPFTPFQWHPMAALNEIKERLKIIKKGVSRIRGVKVFSDLPKYAFQQGIGSLGDRRVSALIETIAAGPGSAVAAEMEKACRDYYIFREKSFEEILPWDFIDAGIPKERLWEEYQKALSG